MGIRLIHLTATPRRTGLPAVAGALAATALALSGCGGSSGAATLPTGTTGGSSTGSAATGAGSSNGSDATGGAGSGSAGTSTPPVAPASGQATVSTVTCPAASRTVRTADDLTAALAEVRAGSTIRLADGVYVGKFVATTSGTASKPIFLCGGAGAVLDGDGVNGGYVMHLDHVNYWRLVGFTVRNGQKGVVADTTQHSVVQGLTVTDVGDEGIHLRDFSADNLVVGNTVRHTGIRRAKFGEGIYVGTAKSNWCTYSDCKPDNSDHNVVEGNTISETTAESVDIKEGTTGGQLLGNRFDGSSLTGADSWVDVKGNGWLIAGNIGHTSPQDGFQTHEVVKGWGTGNTFRANQATVNGPGYGFHLAPVVGNRVSCDNRETGAADGLSNTSCLK